MTAPLKSCLVKPETRKPKNPNKLVFAPTTTIIPNAGEKTREEPLIDKNRRNAKRSFKEPELGKAPAAQPKPKEVDISKIIGKSIYDDSDSDSEDGKKEGKSNKGKKSENGSKQDDKSSKKRSLSEKLKRKPRAKTSSIESPLKDSFEGNEAPSIKFQGIFDIVILDSGNGAESIKLVLYDNGVFDGFLVSKENIEKYLFSFYSKGLTSDSAILEAFSSQTEDHIDHWIALDCFGTGRVVEGTETAYTGDALNLLIIFDSQSSKSKFLAAIEKDLSKSKSGKVKQKGALKGKFKALKSRLRSPSEKKLNGVEKDTVDDNSRRLTKSDEGAPSPPSSPSSRAIASSVSSDSQKSDSSAPFPGIALHTSEGKGKELESPKSDRAVESAAPESQSIPEIQSVPSPKVDNQPEPDNNTKLESPNNRIGSGSETDGTTTTNSLTDSKNDTKTKKRSSSKSKTKLSDPQVNGVSTPSPKARSKSEKKDLLTKTSGDSKKDLKASAEKSRRELKSSNESKKESKNTSEKSRKELKSSSENPSQAPAAAEKKDSVTKSSKSRKK